MVIKQQNAQDQNQIVEKRIIGGQDYYGLPDGDYEEQSDSPAPGKEHHPDQSEFHDQRGAGGESVKLVRQLLHVPADPSWQRTVLVVIVHGGEVTPFEISTQQFHRARLKVDSE